MLHVRAILTRLVASLFKIAGSATKVTLSLVKRLEISKELKHECV